MSKQLIDLKVGDKVYKVVHREPTFLIEEWTVFKVLSEDTNIKEVYFDDKHRFRINLEIYPALKDSSFIKPGQGSTDFYSTSEEKAKEYIVEMCRRYYHSNLVSAQHFLNQAKEYSDQIEKFGGKL